MRWVNSLELLYHLENVVSSTAQSSLSSRPFSFPQSSPSFYLFSYRFLPSPIPTFFSPFPYFMLIPNTTLNTWNKVLDNLEADLTCIPNQIPIKLALFLCPGNLQYWSGRFCGNWRRKLFQRKPVCPKLSRSWDEWEL